MDVESPSSVKFPSTEALNFGVFLMMLGDVDCRLLRTSWLSLWHMVGGEKIPPTRTVLLSLGYLTQTSQSHRLVPSRPVLITFPVVPGTHTLLRATSVMTSFVVGIMSALVVPPQVLTLSGIRGSIVVVIIRRVRLINIFCCKSMFLVSVTFLFFPSLVWVSTFVSLVGSTF